MEIATLNLTLGNAQRSFQYRKGLDDEIIIARVLRDGGFNFGRLRRASELSGLYRRLVWAGKTPLIIDAKANFGASAVYFSHSFEKARVVAIESAQENFDLLVANTAGLSVECLHATVSTSAFGKVQPSAPFAVDGGINLENPVPCVAIGEIYENNANDTLPFIVKVDMEANSARLFASNTEWVSRTPVIVVMLHDGLIPGTENSRAFVEYIANCNRDFFYLEDVIFSVNRDLIGDDIDIP